MARSAPPSRAPTSVAVEAPTTLVVEAPAPVRCQAVRPPIPAPRTSLMRANNPTPAPRRCRAVPPAETVVVSSDDDDDVMIVSEEVRPQPPTRQAELPRNYQAVVPRFYEPAVPQGSRRRRAQQQQLPERLQAAAPRLSINVGGGIAAATNNNNNSYTMKINVKRGIPRRTCFALEFIPGRQRYQSVAQFVNINLDVLRDTLKQHVPPRYKLQVCVEAEFHHATDSQQTKKWHLSTPAEAVEDLDEHLQASATSLDEKITQYSALGSGWRIERVVTLSLVVAEYSDLCRLGGRCAIDTPKMIAKKFCCINVQNTDNRCFLYAVLASLKYDMLPRGTRHRPAVYDRFMDELKYSDEDMPMQLINVPKFERQNPHVIVNIIKFTPPSRLNRLPDGEDAEVFKNPCFDLIYKSNQKYAAADAKIVHLLLVNNSDGQFHYLTVTKLDRLLNCHKNDLVGRQICSHICHSCLRLYRHRAALEKHKPLCDTLKVFGTVYSTPKKTKLEFDQWNKTIPPKFIVYADFESTLEKPTVADDDDDDEEVRSVLQVHKPIAAGSLTLGPDGGCGSYSSFYGEDCVIQFMRHVESLAKEVHQWYSNNAHLPMRQLVEIQVDEHEAATRCYLCSRCFNDHDRCKVHDHDHFTGDYLGACNLARRVRKPVLPVVFHNFRGYDAHHILKHAANSFPEWEFGCIAQSSERFQSVTAYIGKWSVAIRFIDSLQFLCSSLQNLAGMLQPEEKRYINSLRRELPDEARSGKGIFPYSYITSRQVLDAPRQYLRSGVPDDDSQTSCRPEYHFRRTSTSRDPPTAPNLWASISMQHTMTTQELSRNSLGRGCLRLWPFF